MDEGDGVAMMDPDFPDESLPDKPANVIQVVKQTHLKFDESCLDADKCSTAS